MYAPNDPYAILSNIAEKIKLTATEYVRVIDERTGEVKIIEGPMMYTPGPFDTFEMQDRKIVKYKKVKITATQYIIVENEGTGEKTVIRGPITYTPGPFDKIREDNENNTVRNMIVLNNTDYVYTTNTTTGIKAIIEGPTTLTPGPYDEVSDIKKKIVLDLKQYVKIEDQNTGVIRVEKGPATVILQPYEKLLGQKSEAHEVNDHNAVYVFNTDTGNYSLITDHQMFFPSPTQNIIETREKIRLEEHEVVVLIDKEGRYSIVNGNTDGRAFFVPPYCRILQQRWSTDLEKEHKVTKKVERFDTRPQYMDFEFLIRTRDNVEIYLDLNFYWQILDVHKMILQTQDPPADICKHAQSQILGEISRVDMKEFMESFNEIIQGATKQKDDGFYDSRGVSLLRVEITGRRCKDEITERNFQEIIKEKTDRIKNLEKKQGENEIRVCELEGQKNAEKLQGELVSIKRGYMREEATADGESDADRISKFIDNLPDTMTIEQKMAIFFDMKNTERLDMVVKSGTPLYLKPEDLDFSVMNLNYAGFKGSPTPPTVNVTKKDKK